MTSNPAMTPQQERFTDVKRGGLTIYKELAVGKASIFHFLGYELSQLFLSNLPGIIGFGSRSIVYRALFCKCGARPAIGRGVMLRVPKQISLGDGVLVDDYAALDVRGENSAIDLGNRVSIGRFTTVAAKGGTITLKSGVNIGSYCRIATNSRVEIGESTLIGAYCYIGPGNHTESGDGRPLIVSDMEIRGGVEIGENAWLGAGVTVLDGVRIGKRAIIGAHSLVREDVPDDCVAVGTPAKIVKNRSLQSAVS